MNTTIVFTMFGFNSKSRNIKLTENNKYNYSNNRLFKSVFINDNISEITFELQPDQTFENHEEEIYIELERICFNLIIYSELRITQPYCKLKSVKSDSKIKLNDTLSFKETINLEIPLSAASIYKQALESSNAVNNYEYIYKELFII